jgi:hypothetical protein
MLIADGEFGFDDVRLFYPDDREKYPNSENLASVTVK